MTKIDGHSMLIQRICTLKRYLSSSIKIEDTIKPNTKLTNFCATKLIKDLYSRKDSNISQTDNIQMIENAIQIYKEIDEPRNGFVINTFLKLCLHCKQHEQALNILDDVLQILNNEISESKTISYPLLLSVYGRCSLLNAQQIFDLIPNIDKDIICIGLIMKYYIQYGFPHKVLDLYDIITDEQKDDGSHRFAIKACIQCNDCQKGKMIHNSIRDDVDKNDKVEVKTALIEFYNHFGQASVALNIFHSINKSKIDIVSISSMMKCYIDGNEYENALDLYDKVENDYHIEYDDICHVLAIKACIHTNNYDKGKSIHQRIKHLMNDKRIHLKNILICKLKHRIEEEM